MEEVVNNDNDGFVNDPRNNEQQSNRQNDNAVKEKNGSQYSNPAQVGC